MTQNELFSSWDTLFCMKSDIFLSFYQWKTGFSLYFETESLLYNNYNQYKIITNYTKLTYTIYAKNKKYFIKVFKTYVI